MQTENDPGVGWSFDPKALGANGDAAIGAHFEWYPEAPDISPPRAARHRTQDRPVFSFGGIPSSLRSLAQFAMHLMPVTVVAEPVEVLVGFLDFGNLFTGEIRGQTALPELMSAFDFALGLRRGSVAQADVIKLEGPAQLRERVGLLSEENTVVIHVKLQWPAMSQEGGGEKIKVSKEQFALVKFGAGKYATTVIEHVEHGEGEVALREPAMRGGVQLPEFPDLRALPATDRRQHSLGRDWMSQALLKGPATDLSAVQLEGVQPQGLGSCEAVRTSRPAGQALN